MSQFECLKCGNCCRLPGYVRLREGELEAIAEYMRISVESFTNIYTRLTADRRGLSLIENSKGHCIFLSDASRCCIHDVKPQQCRDFPMKWRFPESENVCKALRAMSTAGDRMATC